MNTDNKSHEEKIGCIDAFVESAEELEEFWEQKTEDRIAAYRKALENRRIDPCDQNETFTRSPGRDKRKEIAKGRGKRLGDVWARFYHCNARCDVATDRTIPREGSTEYL